MRRVIGLVDVTEIDRIRLTPPALTQQSFLAVLALLKLTGNADNEYLCDGVIDEFTSALSKLPGACALWLVPWRFLTRNFLQVPDPTQERLDSLDRQGWKRGFVQALIQSQQSVTLCLSVSPDQKVSKNASTA